MLTIRAFGTPSRSLTKFFALKLRPVLCITDTTKTAMANTEMGTHSTGVGSAEVGRYWSASGAI
jgi:hypothetical protein